MGRDTRARGYFTILGPGMDLYRVPMGGRNFEYMNGEDPFLGGQLVPGVIQGIQSQGVWACAKHFVCNDEEANRTNVQILVEDRPLREIYLPLVRLFQRHDRKMGCLAGDLQGSGWRFVREYATERDCRHPEPSDGESIIFWKHSAKKHASLRLRSCAARLAGRPQRMLSLLASPWYASESVAPIRRNPVAEDRENMPLGDIALTLSER